MVSKRVNQRITASAVCIFVIIAIIAVNVLVGIVAAKTNLTIDLTRDKVLSFSPLTKEVIKNLKTNVKITSIVPDSFNDQYKVMSSLRMTLKKYAASSNKITYTVVDTSKDPTFTQKFKRSDGAAIDSNYYVFVESADKYRVIDLNDMVYMNDNYTLFSAEQMITSAIDDLVSDRTSKVYYTNTHNEKMDVGKDEDSSLVSYFKKIFQGEYFTYEPLSLLNNSVPDDASLVIILSPQTDFVDEEIASLDAYLKKGGKAIISLDYQNNSASFDKLNNYFNEWGVKFENGVAYDTNSDNYFNQNPYFLIADTKDSDITKAIAQGGLKISAPYSMPIAITDKNIATPILTTSKSGQILNPQTNESSAKGEINVSVLATKQDTKSSILFLGTKEIFNSYYMDGSGFANKDFLKNTIKYFSDSSSILKIGPKDLSPKNLNMPSSSSKVIIGLTVVLLPLIIFALAVFVWYRRKNL